jgi:hypothetical protein
MEHLGSHRQEKRYSSATTEFLVFFLSSCPVFTKNIVSLIKGPNTARLWPHFPAFCTTWQAFWMTHLPRTGDVIEWSVHVLLSGEVKRNPQLEWRRVTPAAFGIHTGSRNRQLVCRSGFADICCICASLGIAIATPKIKRLETDLGQQSSLPAETTGVQT